MGVFAHRPAPIQVNYLGFPGTLGAHYMDYILADAEVIPEATSNSISEKVVTPAGLAIRSMTTRRQRRRAAVARRRMACPKRTSSSAISTTATS